MKNITVKLIGFVAGAAGFLFLFKIIILDHVSPNDELAPGIVVLAAIFSGLLFGFVANFLKNYLAKKGN